MQKAALVTFMYVKVHLDEFHPFIVLTLPVNLIIPDEIHLLIAVSGIGNGSIIIP